MDKTESNEADVIQRPDARYPYTHACDFIRANVQDFDERLGFYVPTISRSQASQMMRAMSAVLDIQYEELAKKIADYAMLRAREA